MSVAHTLPRQPIAGLVLSLTLVSGATAQPVPRPQGTLSLITETVGLYRIDTWNPSAGGGHLELHVGVRHQRSSGRHVGASVYAASGELESAGVDLRYGWGEGLNGPQFEVGPRIGIYKTNGQYRIPVMGLGAAVEVSRDIALLGTFTIARRSGGSTLVGHAGPETAFHLGGRLGGKAGALVGLALGITFVILGAATAGT